MPNHRAAILVALAFAPIGAATPVAAADDFTAYDFRLDVSGADTADGAARIYADIRRQAVRVCRPLERDGGVWARVEACRAEVRANAVAAVGSLLVLSLHREDEMQIAAVTPDFDDLD